MYTRLNAVVFRQLQRAERSAGSDDLVWPEGCPGIGALMGMRLVGRVYAVNGRNEVLLTRYGFSDFFPILRGMAKKVQSAIVGSIINYIDTIHGYTAGMNYREFASQQMVADACMHNIYVIGKAISDLKDDTKQKSESTPWNLISATHGRLIGENLETDPEAVWHVIETALPELREKLERLQRRLMAKDL